LREDGALQGEYTLKIAGIDQPIPFGRIEPFATVLASLGNAMNAVNAGKDGLTITEQTLAPYLRIGQNLAWFDATNRVHKAFNQRDSDTQPDAYDKAMEMLIAKPVSAALPALIKSYTARGDDTHRGPNADQIAHIEENYGKEFARYIGEAWGISDTPAKIAPSGEPVRRGPFAPAESTLGKIAVGAAERVIKGGFGAVPQSIDAPSVKAIDAFRERLSDDLKKEVTNPTIRQSFTEHKQKYQLSAKEYENFQKTYYKTYNEELKSVVDTLGDLYPNAEGASGLKKQLETARKLALGDAKDEVLTSRGE